MQRLGSERLLSENRLSRAAGTCELAGPRAKKSYCHLPGDKTVRGEAGFLAGLVTADQLRWVHCQLLRVGSVGF